MFYRTADQVLFRLDRVIALHPLTYDDLEGMWIVRIDGCVGDELGVRCTREEAREIVALLEERFGLV